MQYKNLNELFDHNVNERPNKEFLFFEDRVYTYKQTQDEIIKIAKVLRDNGVRKGDRVTIFLGNSAEYFFSYFAIMRLGAIAMPANSFLKENELANNMNDCSSGYIITSPTYGEVVKETAILVPTLKKIFAYEDMSSRVVNINSYHVKDDSDINVELTCEDVATLIYTSGTTGRPKGVMLTHHNLIENAKSTSAHVNVTDDDKFVLILPMFHSYTFTVCALTPIVEGAQLIIFESLLETSKDYYKDVLKNMRPTVICGVPPFYSAMARKKVMDDMPFRVYISGGAPLPVEIINMFKETYGRAIVEGYGLSEASPVCTINPLDIQKPGTVGKPVANVEVKVVDKDGNTLGANEDGELCIKGPNVMKGYWNQPEETGRVLRDGWLHTGDMARIDEDGFVSIVDRIKDLIIVKGMNIYPREIEEVLYTYPGVLMAAVIGIPDKDGSDKVVAYVKMDSEKITTEEKLKLFVKGRLANFKVPKQFVFTDDIPLNASNKVAKRELRERILSAMKKVSN